jgi:protein-ribulosamine 3-kinase
MSLAQKLALLHTTPAPIPPGHSTPQFGFPTTTCCGDTPQPNTFTSSWSSFYTTHRLHFIASRCRGTNGTDPDLTTLISTTCERVIPRLLDPSRLNGGKGITPVVIHGDLWSGNASTGLLPGMTEAEDIVYDSSACYAHSEFELGVMRMFGGFGREFWEEYHALVPKTEPVGEWEDRVALYELYHHLNHYALFGGGYRSGAVRIMRDLIKKYGGE